VWKRNWRDNCTPVVLLYLFAAGKFQLVHWNLGKHFLRLLIPALLLDGVSAEGHLMVSILLYFEKYNSITTGIWEFRGFETNYSVVAKLEKCELLYS
jgi:hypothetical protein